jgi:hypothetical protein
MGTGLTNKLQGMQNNLPRTVCDALERSRDQRSSQELLRELHWLPVAARINFKIVLVCLKAYRLWELSYIHTLIQSYVPARSLRSSGDHE